MAMKLSQLRMLVAVADHGSFSAAAAQLDCTQSRISHAIGELERELGVRLLARTRVGSAPTDAGHRVLDKARQMLRIEASLLDAARDSQALAGRVRIACFRSVGTHLLPHALEALALEYPGIEIEIDDGCDERDDVAQAVLQGRADIGIAQRPVDDALAWQPYLFDSYRLVLPASLAPRIDGGWPALDGLPFIALACSGAAAVLERCRVAGFAAQPSRTLANDTSIAAMVGRGMGFSILPELSVFPRPDEVRTLALPIPARREFVIAALPGTMRAPAVKAVLRFLRDKRIVARTRAYQGGIVSWE
ncbi:LysR family transcriptional regulator [Massilia agilis]|uniref:LysR family transcriptional regulator n=1 Tax=Massilia agilis TaxID=1811226 RepID=A0ABT2D890_9BURK|nr:LysR family transcriptional regulator [Massilia agilis]MCS0807532.1 LysR family transcriptional regulator [Massilia agilis]